MKKLLLPGIFLISAFTLSCEKEEFTETNPISTQSGNKVKSLTSMEDYDDRRLAFSLLSNEEKAQTWQEHFDFCLEQIPMNFKQRTLVLEAKQFATPEFYNIEPGNESEEFLVLTQKIKIEFKNPNLFKIIFDDILNSQQIEEIIVAVAPPSEGARSCRCSVKSDYCPWIRPDNLFVCQDVTCSVRYGCGWLWGYVCNGVCLPI